MTASGPPAQPGAAAVTSLAPSSAAGGPLPFARRSLDIILVAFFLINLGFITYIVDLEQLVIADPFHFQYPIWPPAPLVDLVHAHGRALDPVPLARPVWWKATIWIDALFFGPFYAVAAYAYINGKSWIRLPSIIWASVMLTNVTIILAEERFGPYATPHFGIVLLLNLPWLIVPILVIARMAAAERPFTAAPSARDEHLGLG